MPPDGDTEPVDESGDGVFDLFPFPTEHLLVPQLVLSTFAEHVYGKLRKGADVPRADKPDRDEAARFRRSARSFSLRLVPFRGVQTKVNQLPNSFIFRVQTIVKAVVGYHARLFIRQVD
jgi:hypothetical protein